MSKLVPQPGIMDINPYVGGESKVPGVSRIIKLASNESALGCSPKAAEAYRAYGNELHRYPDGGSAELREAILPICTESTCRASSSAPAPTS